MSQEITEQETAVLNSGRMLREGYPLLLPILKEQEETAISNLIYAFKEGREPTTLLAFVAQLSGARDAKSSIENKIKKAEIIERKIHR